MEASEVMLLLDSDLEGLASYSSDNVQLMEVCAEHSKESPEPEPKVNNLVSKGYIFPL